MLEKKKKMTMSYTHHRCPPKAITKFKEMTMIVLMVIISLEVVNER
jgi:hypothetical protein